MRWLVFLALVCASARAALPVADGSVLPFQRRNYPLKDLMKDYAETLQKNVSFDGVFQKESRSSDLNVHSKMTFADYTTLVKSILAGHGYALIEERGFSWIMELRDVRFLALPVYAKELPPNDESFVASVFTLKYAVGHEVARNMRPFVSRYGRIIDLADRRTLILMDKGETARNIRSAIEFMDNEKLFKALLAKKAPETDDPVRLQIAEKMVELELKNKVLEKKLSEQNAGPAEGMLK